ncbi:MAG: hypothetical protein KDI10_19390, partial [Halioglobus sp.]|nr:hypothetical protein [Halioglobus sp.]
MLRNFHDIRTGVAGTLLVLLFAVLPGGCADSDQLSEQERAALEQRVRERWQTLVDRDFEKTWEYSTPAFRRIFSKSLYLGNFSYATEWELTGIEVLNYDAR